MDKNCIAFVAGTRPEIIKLYPVIKSIDKIGLCYYFIWSGQHYDYNLSKIFFEQFQLHDPHYNLGVGSGTHAEQTAKIMIELEKVLQTLKPALVVAQGDTNTVLAAALTSAKLSIPFAHIEAGARSWNMKMPEEINRRVADAIASIHYASTYLAAINLLFEGIPKRRIHITGSTAVDVVYEFLTKVEKIEEDILAKYGAEPQSYALVTIHRAENTDNPQRLAAIIKALENLARHMPVIFPIHPRTKNTVVKAGLQHNLRDIKLLEPLGYFEFLTLMKNAKVVLTDSGGFKLRHSPSKYPL